MSHFLVQLYLVKNPISVEEMMIMAVMMIVNGLEMLSQNVF